MNCSFKVGDKVRCINNYKDRTINEETIREDMLELNKVYTIDQIFEDRQKRIMLKFEEQRTPHHFWQWFANRFVAVKTKRREG